MNCPARLLASGIEPVFFTFPFSQWQKQKTDISGYSGGTATEFHRVPLAWGNHLNSDLIYKNPAVKSIFSFLIEGNPQNQKALGELTVLLSRIKYIKNWNV